MSVPKTIRARDTARLALILPALRVHVVSILKVMDELGFPMFVAAGARTIAEQQALYAQGRTAPGRIVTNADGVKKPSNHQVKADGFGHAVDCVFLIDGPDRDGELETPSWDEAHPWSLYGELAETVGRGRIIWGGRWKTLRDMPHIEWRG